jgi:hypothetical protein
MKNKKLEIDVFRLLSLINLLPSPITYAKDKYVVAISGIDSFSEITFLKKNNKWNLLMYSNVEKTHKLHGREYNAVWIDEIIEQSVAN